MTMRLFVVAAAFTACAVTQEMVEEDLLAQRAMSKLRGPDLASVAWGGYHVAESRLLGCIPEVRAQLAKLREARTGASFDAVQALLDALVRTDAVLTAEELAPFRRHEAALVLMSRDPAAHRESLRRAFHGQHEDPWAPRDVRIPWMGGFTNAEQIACGNLLAGLADPDLVSELLQAPVEVWVSVGDRGTLVEAQVPVGGGFTSCARRQAVDGLPPMARYEYALDGRAGDIEVASGHRQVFAHRSWYGTGLHCSFGLAYEEYQTARIAWLTQVLGEGVRQRAESLTKPMAFAWKDAAAALAALDERRAAIERDLRAIAQAGVTAGLFPAAEAKAWQARIWFRWIDGRTDQKVPLPDANPPAEVTSPPQPHPTTVAGQRARRAHSAGTRPPCG